MSGYPLATPLALRAREERAARVALGAALSEEVARRAEREAHAQRVAEHAERQRQDRLAAAREGEGAAELDGRARFAGRLRAEAAGLAAALARSEQSIEDAQEEVEERRRSLADARSALRALERHREGWSAARGRVRRRREEAAVDDAVSGLRAEP